MALTKKSRPVVPLYKKHIRSRLSRQRFERLRALIPSAASFLVNGRPVGLPPPISHRDDPLYTINLPAERWKAKFRANPTPKRRLIYRMIIAAENMARNIGQGWKAETTATLDAADKKLPERQEMDKEMIEIEDEDTLMDLIGPREGIRDDIQPLLKDVGLGNGTLFWGLTEGILREDHIMGDADEEVNGNGEDNMMNHLGPQPETMEEIQPLVENVALENGLLLWGPMEDIPPADHDIEEGDGEYDEYYEDEEDDYAEQDVYEEGDWEDEWVFSLSEEAREQWPQEDNCLLGLEEEILRRDW